MSDWKRRLFAGEAVVIDEPDFAEEQEACMELLYDINSTRPGEKQKRQELFKRFFGAVGKDLYIELPVHANWGRNVYWGDNCYANFNLTLVDDVDIRIGSHCLFAPNVVIATASHPLEPNLRRKFALSAKPVTIGDNVWIGSGAVVCPGVTIGENCVIGAGAVVVSDIPPNTLAVGVPARAIKEIPQD
ncbi:MAG: sugar O-acetyltransferase [Clostridium sp.]|jgi:galactoside O-acetyltransferase|nr:sugar O-acetyltransferase [Clostridium sp.]